MTTETMPREQQRALADMCRFERLEKFAAGYAASTLHLPELAHEAATIEALVRAGLAAREGRPLTGVVPTLRGRQRNHAIEAERLGEPAQ